jgi:hypothetical protein
MGAHHVQDAVHFGQQSERIIQLAASISQKARDQGFLPANAGFLLRDMPDAHLQFCLTFRHGAPPRQPPPALHLSYRSVGRATTGGGERRLSGARIVIHAVDQEP